MFSLGEGAAPGGKPCLQIRAWKRAHLELLKQRFGLRQEIIATPGADYPWRMEVGRRKTGMIIGAIARETRWKRFKTEAERNTGDREYGDFLHRVFADASKRGPGLDDRKPVRITEVQLTEMRSEDPEMQELLPHWAEQAAHVDLDELVHEAKAAEAAAINNAGPEAQREYLDAAC